MMSSIILYSVNKLNELNINAGKTFIQKLLYFSLNKEERNELYIPYFFGPYSESIQSVLNSLIQNEYLNYENNKLTSDYYIDKFTKTDKEKINNINKVLEFLNKVDFDTTKDISLLAKVHMIINEYETGKRQIESIKNIAFYLGWKELANLNENEIKKYLKHCEKLV